MKDTKKRFLLIMQILAALQIIFSFIPLFNPFGVGGAAGRPLIGILGKIGEVSAYFAGQSVNAIPLNNTFFVFALIILVSLLFILMTTILTLTQTDFKKTAIKINIFFSVVLTAMFFALFVIITDQNTQILSANTGEIHRKFQILTHTPIGVYTYFVLSLAQTIFAYLAYGFDWDAIRYSVRSRFTNQFKGGIHPPYNKITSGETVKTMPADQQMVYPVSQHIGAPCHPLVKVGDDVRIGQKIADCEQFVCAPVHATVSGKVTAVELRAHPTMGQTMSIVVENDFEDRMDPSIENISRDYTTMDAAEIIGYVREAGIVGMGGAAFPTHVKMKSALGKVDTVIINAAECEPYLSSDHRVLLENTAEFSEGVKIIRHAMGVRRVYIGIEANKPDAISRLYRAFRKTGIKIVVLNTKYPQGSEKQLIKAVTGREVPSGKLPADVKCCVFNVDTAVAIYRAVAKGYPLMRRIVTVAGNAISAPGNANVRLGTSVRSVLSFFGLRENDLKKLIMGGPMMGNALYDLDVPVVKGTSGLLGFTAEQVVEDQHRNACIRCGRCITVCPMRLTPVYLNLHAMRGEYDACEKLSVLDCMECGCCSYTCPAKLPLLQRIRVAKQKVREQQQAAKE